MGIHKWLGSRVRQRPGWHALVLHLLVAAAMVLAPVCRLKASLWELPAGSLLVLALFAAAYIAAAGALHVRQPAAVPVGALGVSVVASAAFGIAFACYVLLQWLLPGVVPAQFPRSVLFLETMLGMTALLGMHWLHRSPSLTLAAAGTIFLVSLAGELAYAIGILPEPRQPSRQVSYVSTSLYYLQRTTYRDYIPGAGLRGGGLTQLSDGILLATGDGRLFYVRNADGSDALYVKRLTLTVPLNAEIFRTEAPRVFAGQPSDAVEVQWFRVADVFAQQRGESVRLFASHHYWNDTDMCTVLRVSVLQAPLQEILEGGKDLRWRTLYESSPCLPLNTKGPRGSRFAGLEAGGRLALLNDDELLLSVGSHEFNGWDREPALPQDLHNSYGKIVLLHLADGTSELYSLGLRNPQGLFVDERGVIWSTDHGPQGGDEINVIRRGANYGWPNVTYGTEYGQTRWPLNPVQGRHDGFDKPLYAFVPSYGLSDIISIRGKLFPLWHNDLLVASLRGGQLWRVRLEEGRVVITEPIKIERRIRDVLEDATGRMVLWTDEGEIIVLEPSRQAAGEALAYQCAGCHSLKTWEPSTTGPNLTGVVGRRVGALADFRYSKAMSDFGGKWTRDRLDAFLANPARVVPGNTMQFAGMRDATQRQELIGYLEKLHR